MNYLNTETLNKLAKIRNSIMEDNGVTQVELMESVGLHHNKYYLKELIEIKFSDYEMREYAKDNELYQEDYNDRVAELTSELQEELAEDPEIDIEDAFEEQILEHVVEQNKTSIQLSILEDIKEEIEETLLKSISTYNKGD